MEAAFDKDTKILGQFIEIYCNGVHRAHEKSPWMGGEDFGMTTMICSECSDLLSYSVRRRTLCPLDPKPSCKNCEVQCYSGEYRSRIREVMRYSGKRLILQGRFDLILHYLF